MDTDAVQHDSVVDNGCTSRHSDGMGFIPNVGKSPLLCSEPGVDVRGSGRDLYVCDQHSWLCIRGLLNLLEKKDGQFCNGISNGCVLLAVDECGFAWTLRQSSSQFGAVDLNVFYW